jgi:hypothetical protein
MSISENLTELTKIKDGIKDVVNKFGGACEDDFSEYKLNIERILVEGFIRVGETIELNISEGVQKIKDYAFYKNALISAVTIPNTVLSIGASAFQKCTNLTSITISDTVTTIGKEAFSECYNLKTVTLPNHLTTIEYQLFYHCMNLSSVTIPDSVTVMKTGIFSGCNNLKEVIYQGPLTKWKEIVKNNSFDGIFPHNVKLKCTDGEYKLNA